MMDTHENVATAFGLTLFAGLATGIGSVLAFFASTRNGRFLSVSLGFSAGVMLYVSFTEILGKAQSALSASYGEDRGEALAVAAFFLGVAVIGVIDRLIPSISNPHEARGAGELAGLHEPDAPGGGADWKGMPRATRGPLMRMGLFTALAIAIHNFPEGLATFLSALEDPKVGLMLAIAVALHNIPEGISVSVPIYYATGSRRKGFVLSLLSGLAEPVGALVGYLVLASFLSEAMMGVLFAMVGGIMVFIAIDELIPTARAYGKTHDAVYGTIGGMGVMATSLVLM